MERIRKFTKQQLLGDAKTFIEKGYFETTIKNVAKNEKGLELVCYYPYEISKSETRKYSSLDTREIETTFEKKFKELKSLDIPSAKIHSELKQWFINTYKEKFVDVEKSYRNIYRNTTKAYKMQVVLKSSVNIFYRKINNENLLFSDFTVTYIDYMDNEGVLLPSTTIFSNKECKKIVRITAEEIEKNINKFSEYAINTLSNAIEIRKACHGDFKEAIQQLQNVYKQSFEDSEKMRIAMLTAKR